MVIRSQVPVPRSSVGRQAPTGAPIAQGIGRIASALKGFTDHLVQGRVQRETIEARGKAREGLFALEEEYAKSDDFTDIGERYAADTSKLYDEISKGFSIGAGRDAFAEGFADLAISSGFRVRKEATRREGDLAVASLDAGLELGTEAFATGRITAEEARAAAAEEIDRAAAAGWISEQSAVSRASAFERTILDSSALKAIEADPRSVDLDASGPYGALGDLRRLELKSRRDTMLARDAANADRARREIEARARLQFGDIKDTIDAGFLPDNDALENVGRMVIASGDEALMKDYRETVQRGATAAIAQTLPPNELSAALAAARKTAASDPDAARMVITLEKVATAQRNGVKGDAVGHYAKVTGTALPEIGADAQPEILRQRLAFADATRAQYGVSNVLRPQERDVLKQHIETADAAALGDFASRIAKGAGGQARRVFGELSEDAPAFARLGDLSLLPGSMAAASDGFSGMAILRDNPKILPRKDNDARFSQINMTLSGVLAEGSEAVSSSIIDAADAIYAARATRKGLDAFDEDLYRQALHDAAGRSPVGGGIGTYNGGKLLLPPDLDSNALTNGISKLDAQGWSKISMTGAPPIHGNGDVVSGRDLKKVQLVTVGPNHYQLKTATGVYLNDAKTGERFVVNLTRGPLSEAAGESATRSRVDDLEWRIKIAPTRHRKAKLQEELARVKSGEEQEPDIAEGTIATPITPVFF